MRGIYALNRAVPKVSGKIGPWAELRNTMFRNRRQVGRTIDRASAFNHARGVDGAPRTFPPTILNTTPTQAPPKIQGGGLRRNSKKLPSNNIAANMPRNHGEETESGLG
jgi:hypothetical protein